MWAAALDSSLPGLTRQSILSVARKKMDVRVKPAHDERER
jgi:branched-subunit amino acid aminotransferase/4-amino-4-deoxychorismate lyase